jgi:hypothetical protein
LTWPSACVFTKIKELFTGMIEDMSLKMIVLESKLSPWDGNWLCYELIAEITCFVFHPESKN